MKPTPFKEASLLLGAIGGAALALGSINSLRDKETIKGEDQELCIISREDSDLNIGECRTRATSLIYCGKEHRSEIDLEKSIMKETQTRVRDVTPLLGKFLGIKVEKTYPNLKFREFHIDMSHISPVDDDDNGLMRGVKLVRCESLSSTLRISNQSGSHQPTTLKEKIVVAADDAIGFIVGLVALCFTLPQLLKRKKKKKAEKEADLQTLAELKTRTVRIGESSYRKVIDNSKLEATKQFLLRLKSDDLEKYNRWIAAIEAKALGKSIYFKQVESSWEEVFQGWTTDQCSQLLAELEAETETEEFNHDVGVKLKRVF